MAEDGKMCVTGSPVCESIDNYKSWCKYANTHIDRGELVTGVKYSTHPQAYELNIMNVISRKCEHKYHIMLYIDVFMYEAHF